ncbi:MAG: shikimate kinase [Actinobacteria bacterium]|jgi:shikimate kinase|nr:shikimate kinase [Actinomycetota bacterium]
MSKDLSLISTEAPHRRPAVEGVLVLIGMMGVGKSTVGRILAEKVGAEFVDTDQVIEERIGLSIKSIFSQRGEGYFRDRETEVLADALRCSGPLVVSVGGGAVGRPENKRLLNEANLVVWLRASPATIWSRIVDSVDRPLLERGGLEGIIALTHARSSDYAEVSTVVVDVDDLDIDRVVADVLKCWQEL